MPFDSRRQAIQLARTYYQARPVFLDTETTGLDGWDEIIEISIIDHDGSVLVSSFVCPTKPIPAASIAVHHITDEMVRQAPTWPEVWKDVEAALVGRYVGIYNAEFDKRMMRQSHSLYGLEWALHSSKFFCIMDLFTQFYGRRAKLETAGRYFGITIPNAHRSQADAMLAREVLYHLAHRG